jgi:hypothetical protein
MSFVQSQEECSAGSPSDSSAQQTTASTQESAIRVGKLALSSVAAALSSAGNSSAVLPHPEGHGARGDAAIAQSLDTSVSAGGGPPRARSSAGAGAAAGQASGAHRVHQEGTVAQHAPAPAVDHSASTPRDGAAAQRCASPRQSATMRGADTTCSQRASADARSGDHAATGSVRSVDSGPPQGASSNGSEGPGPVRPDGSSAAAQGSSAGNSTSTNGVGLPHSNGASLANSGGPARCTPEAATATPAESGQGAHDQRLVSTGSAAPRERTLQASAAPDSVNGTGSLASNGASPASSQQHSNGASASGATTPADTNGAASNGRGAVSRKGAAHAAWIERSRKGADASAASVPSYTTGAVSDAGSSNGASPAPLSQPNSNSGNASTASAPADMNGAASNGTGAVSSNGASPAASVWRHGNGTGAIAAQVKASAGRAGGKVPSSSSLAASSRPEQRSSSQVWQGLACSADAGIHRQHSSTSSARGEERRRPAATRVRQSHTGDVPDLPLASPAAAVQAFLPVLQAEDRAGTHNVNGRELARWLEHADMAHRDVSAAKLALRRLPQVPRGHVAPAAAEVLQRVVQVWGRSLHVGNTG